MSLKIARWCAIYSFGVSIAMVVVNFMRGGFDWGFVIVTLVVSGGMYYYLEYVLEPQLQAKEAEEAAALAAAEAEAKEAARRRRRPRLKKQP